VHMVRGRLQEALQSFSCETSLSHRLLALVLVHHACGRHRESDAALTELLELPESAAYQIAVAYAYRNEANLAFEWLERAYLQRDSGLTVMKVSPFLKNLHDDPRWLPFLRKMGLVG